MPTEADAATPQRKGAATRQTILEAAIIRFGREGYRSTSVADIARDAGVGSTITYAYFPNKEALFLAALDEDAAGVIAEGVSATLGADSAKWSQSLMITLLSAVDHHPLARRVLAGLEPHVTDRMVDIPALAQLRKSIAERLRADQMAGRVRADIDPVSIANGAVAITLSLLMSMLQFGTKGAEVYGDDVLAVFEAAIQRTPSFDRPKERRPRRR
ncbi:MAG: TetR/AcrR family transcriptional regulator [Actinobacteria bacterium]|nr:TetR/AcrR family transcriptional regulator [Actinomycetota bacterium]